MLGAPAESPKFKLGPDESSVVWEDMSFAPVPFPVEPDHEYKTLRCRQKQAQLQDAVPAETVKGFVLASVLCEEIRNYYLDFHEHEMNFATVMGNAYILSPQNTVPMGSENPNSVPHSLITEMFRLVYVKTIKRIINTRFASPAILVQKLNTVYLDFACADACANEVLLRALDACAILGGVALPQWPPHPEWQGARFNWADIPTPGININETQFRLLAAVRRFERWGVPVWNFNVSSAKTRLDVAQDGLPSEGLFDETLYQSLLNTRFGVETKPILQVTARIATDDLVAPARSGIPTGAARHRLQQAIINLVAPKSVTLMNFATFSAIAQDILGKEIWSGQRHEANLHPPSFDLSTKMPWSRVRDAPRECSHSGVLVALFQIPLPWVNPQSSVASVYGAYSAFEQLPPSLAVAPRQTWLVLEIDDFSQHDQSSAELLVQRLSSDGLYGWCFVQSGLQRKDAEGKTIPRSRYTLRMLFKQHHTRERVGRSIGDQYNDHEQRTREEVRAKDDFLFNYSFFAHPRFVDVAYAEPISAVSRSQIMHLAPSFDVARSSSGSKDRATEVKRAIHDLRFVQLLEAKLFPPLVAPPGLSPLLPSSSSRSAPSPPPMDMSSCSTATLCQLASSATPTDELSFMDVCRMQRFAYILEVLIKDGPFLARVFPSSGPYLKILRYFARTIRDSSPAGSTFTSRSVRQNISPFHEAVRLTNTGRVDIIINVDMSDSDIALPTQADVDRYHETLAKQWEESVKKPSRSESRRRKIERQIADGIASAVAGPSRLS